MPKDHFPNVSAKLVEALEAAFPDRCPSLTDTDREVWFQAGAASVVQFLRLKREEQNETHFEDE